MRKLFINLALFSFTPASLAAAGQPCIGAEISLPTKSVFQYRGIAYFGGTPVAANFEIIDQSALNEFWAQVKSSVAGVGAAPSVDFSKNMVVAIIRSGADSSVKAEIESICLEQASHDSMLTVRSVRSMLPRNQDCLVFDSNHAAIDVRTAPLSAIFGTPTRLYTAFSDRLESASTCY